MAKMGYRRGVLQLEDLLQVRDQCPTVQTIGAIGATGDGVGCMDLNCMDGSRRGVDERTPATKGK